MSVYMKGTCPQRKCVLENNSELVFICCDVGAKNKNKNIFVY